MKRQWFRTLVSAGVQHSRVQRPKLGLGRERVALELQNRSQPLIDRALQARRKRAGMFSEETAVKGQKLRDIHDRVTGEARRACRQQDIPWGVGEFQVCGDRGYDRGLNPAAIEGIRL